MPFGRFASFPYRFGGGKPEAQRIYEGMRDGMGERFSKDDDTDDNKTLRCEARQLAIASSYQRRGAHQAHATMATDLLPDWERRLGVVRNPRDNEYARRRLLGAILAGNGPPDVDSIEAALASALGESVTIVTQEAPALKTFSGVVTSYSAATFTDSASRLDAGTHYFRVAWETPTDIRATSAIGSLSVTAGQAVRLGALSLATVAGSTAIHWYMSVRANSTVLAHIGTTTGAGFDVFDYPSNPGLPDLHHVAAVVSDAVANDRGQRSKIHEILGTMLSAWTTYSIATSSSGFLLGESLLGEDSF